MKHRVLEEEVKEAHGVVAVTAIVGGFAAFLWAASACVGIDRAGLAAVPWVALFGLATLFCLGWFWRARRTIRRWRDQERERLAIAEAEKIGKDLPK